MPHANRQGDRIIVTSQFSEKELVKAIPGSRWDSHEKTWTLPLTWSACLQLRGSFGQNLTVGPELAKWSYDEFHNRVNPSLALRTEISRVTADIDPKLYDFQTAGVMFMETAQSGLLGDDMGLGKTAQVLALIRMLANVNPAETLPALVICPNSVKTGWAKQVKLWNINVTPYIVTGSPAQRRKIIEAAREDPRALVIINIESVRLLSRLAPYGSIRLSRCRTCDPAHGEERVTPARCDVHPKLLNDFGFKTVILDEAHRIKDPSSKQTRACWAVAHGPTVARRWALTGTPVANHVGDLWSIMHFVAPDEYPTKSKFVDRYGLQAWNAFGGLDIVGVNPATSEEFYKILDPRFRRTPKRLVAHQLPKVVRATRWVDMVPKQEAAYKNLEQSLITVLDNGQVLIAPNNLVNATRLLQLSSSYCDVEWIPAPTDDDPNNMKIVVTLAEPSPKLDAMEDDLEELGDKPVVIAAMSRQLIELAAKRLTKRKIPFGLITGAVNEWDRQRDIQRFVNNELRIMLMTIGAGGTGVDGLQHADTMLVLQRSWSMIENLQVDGRIDRFGAEKHDSITIVDYVARGTIEETTQHPRLLEKYERLEEINRDRQRLRQHSTIDTKALDEEEARILESHLGAPM